RPVRQRKSAHSAPEKWPVSADSCFCSVLRPPAVKSGFRSANHCKRLAGDAARWFKASIMKRRILLKRGLLGMAGAALPSTDLAGAPAFKLNYLLGSALYGDLPLATVIEETPKTGAKFLDIWPRKWATQREQMDEMGHEKVME